MKTLPCVLMLCALSPVALAAGDDPGSSAAVKLALNGLMGEANMATGNPPVNFTVKNAVDNITLGATSMRDFSAMAGATVHHYTDDGDNIDWACLESPAGDGAAAMQVWVFSHDIGTGKGKITGVAAEAAPATAPAGCATLDKPFAIDFGAPAPGAGLTEITAKFGPAEHREEDGTTSYIYGSVRKLPEHMIVSAEFKYAFDGDTATAIAVQEFSEEE